MLVAVLDGIGLTLFIPLLQVTDQSGNTAAASDEMGKMSIVIDAIQGLGIDLTISSVLLLMLFFFCLKGMAKFASGYYTVILKQRFTNSVRLRNMELLAGYDYQSFVGADSGMIQNTFSGEVERLNAAYRNYFFMLQQSIMCVVYVALAYFANPQFALIVAVGGVLSNLLFNRIYKTTKKASRQITLKTHIFQGFLIQSVTSFKFLKATDLMQNYKRKIDHIIQKVEIEQRRVGTMGSLAAAMREPLIIFIVVIGILIQIEIFGGSLGSIILSLLFFYRGLTYLVATQSFYNGFLGNSGSIENMETFVSTLENNQETIGPVELVQLRKGLELKDLTYGYDGYDLLQNLDLRVEKNETLGVVGESGTGKTTLVNILCGLLRVQDGMYKVDGIDSTELNMHDLRRRIGYVTQEAQVFSDNIFNNVSFWEERTPENEERVWKALKLSHAAEFVNELPDRLDSVIGSNGINLSGGQRQRISIARELYRDIDILVLDEATSALDSQSENLIQENIESLSGSYTMIVIAHRLSTIKNADKILYLKRNGEYEIGSFNDLCRTSTTFQRMVALQSVG